MKTLINAIMVVTAQCLWGCTRVAYTIKPELSGDILPLCTAAEPGMPAHANTTDHIKTIAFGQAGNNGDISTTVLPLANGFAHNDYIHKRPLYDALENGFTNIEADVFLVGGKLIVAHICPYFKGNRTLETLYLKPLFERITQNHGKVYAGYNVPVTLMIDIKTNADHTYKALKPLLEKYRSILSCYENGALVNRAVTVVISGRKPVELIKMEKSRLAFIDKDLLEVSSDPVNDHVYNMASCKYSAALNWKGHTTIPASEKKKLCDLVERAHKIGARVRLWASPEKKEVWDELLRCGVDLINTNQLITLRNYFAAKNHSAVMNAASFSSLDLTAPVKLDVETNGDIEQLSFTPNQ